MLRKFNIGDKVRINERAPNHVTQEMRRRTRTVVEIYRDPRWGASLYALGLPGKTQTGYLFRSYMLEPATDTSRVGRPSINHGESPKIPVKAVRLT